jgi:hypothetical protein
VEFVKVEIEFDDGQLIKITQFDLPQVEARSGLLRGYKVELINGGDGEAWEPFARPEEGVDRRRIVPPAIDRFVPHLSRISAKEWRDPNHGDVLSLDEVIDRYWHAIPESYRHTRGGPIWLRTLRESVECQLIETQRLIAKRKELRGYEREEPAKPAVSAYRDALGARMEAILAESATLSQSLDRTFPNRLLARMRDKRNPLTEVELRSRLVDLERKRARLTEVDLLTHSDDNALISDERFDKPTSRILTEYVIDTEKKLGAYEDILARLELFTELLNEKLNFKTIKIKRESGFEIRDVKDRIVEPKDLSSGEQHELILFFDLIFGRSEGKLILIDEPEISLHIAWQKKFIPDLQRIVALSPMDVVISTHSPQLISHYRNLVETLRRPNV